MLWHTLKRWKSNQLRLRKRCPGLITFKLARFHGIPRTCAWVAWTLRYSELHSFGIICDCVNALCYVSFDWFITFGWQIIISEWMHHGPTCSRLAPPIHNNNPSSQLTSINKYLENQHSQQTARSGWRCACRTDTDCSLLNSLAYNNIVSMKISMCT